MKLNQFISNLTMNIFANYSSVIASSQTSLRGMLGAPLGHGIGHRSGPGLTQIRPAVRCRSLGFPRTSELASRRSQQHASQ